MFLLSALFELTFLPYIQAEIKVLMYLHFSLCLKDFFMLFGSLGNF